MRCPECVAADERSTVRVVPGESGHLDRFYDEDGEYHVHAEPGETRYQCARGHEFGIPAVGPPCPSCDWPALR